MMSSDVLLMLISLCKDCFVVRCAEILLRIGLLDAIRLISHTLVCLSCYASVRRSSCAPVPASLARSASANLRPRLGLWDRPRPGLRVCVVLLPAPPCSVYSLCCCCLWKNNCTVSILCKCPMKTLICFIILKLCTDIAYVITWNVINEDFFILLAGGMKKCRARYGLDQQDLWCKPCRYESPLFMEICVQHEFVFIW